MKKLSFVFILAIFPISVFAQLQIWSFNDELAVISNSYYKNSHPDVKYKYSLTHANQFQSKLDKVLHTGQGAPDIIALEASLVRKYVESGFLLDITDVYIANKDKLLAYPVDVGMYNGRVYALSWQVCPGAMFYRRSLAKKYLGTDAPEVVQTYFADFKKLLITARLLKEESGGSCVLVSSSSDLYNSFLAARKNPWIVNGKLVIDPVMEQYMDYCKTMRDNRWEGRLGQWSEGWFAGMIDMLKDEYGNAVEVFSYFLPIWGLHYVLKTNAPNTAGDWAMIQGPSSYYWGGTWIGAYKGTKNAAAAKEFIRYVTADDAFLEAWAKDTGDMVSSVNVINKIKDSYSESYLDGQNQYAEFAEMAKGVNGSLSQKNDELIEGFWEESVTAFLNGEKTKEEALADFSREIKSQLGL
jgi:ABC-type glycerol-3-phosphate transport system substrate-binding protein